MPFLLWLNRKAAFRWKCENEEKKCHFCKPQEEGFRSRLDGCMKVGALKETYIRKRRMDRDKNGLVLLVVAQVYKVLKIHNE